MASRSALNKLLWVAVKKLPGGEPTLRDMVVHLHQVDGSTPPDGFATDSTRGLSDAQFSRLVDLVLARVGRPTPSRRPRGDQGAPLVTHFATDGEKAQIKEIADQLAWTDDTLEEFIRRQTKGRGVRTHRDATAVLTPMKRMLTTRRVGAGK